MSEPSRDQQLEAILHSYLQAVDAGQNPDRKELLRRYPDFADELREFFTDQSRMDHMAQAINKVGADAITLGAEEASDGMPRIRYFGDYELLAEIARGGMGVVYKARQVSLNRMVALKMILAGQLASPADVRRFHVEAEAAANLDHPNIVPIYEVGEHEGQHFFSMKLIEGSNLAAAKSASNEECGASKDEQRKAARLLATVARAVHHAHQRGILHRDLKPANILLDSAGDPYISDFGLARHVEGESGMTQSGAIVGTPSYMAPEQARAEKGLTTAVDVYGLGAILYERLTGQAPFRGATPLEILRQVQECEPVRPRSLRPAIDRDLEAICLKCLDKEPSQRYGSALALAEDLACWLTGQPIQARPSWALQRMLKWVKRNRKETFFAAVLVCWLFNVHALIAFFWLAWVLCAALLLSALWSLARLVGWAFARPIDEPLDVFNLMGTLAMWVLVFPAGEIAQQIAVVLLLSYYAGCILRWLWWRRRAGTLSLALRPTGFPSPHNRNYVCGTAFVAVFMFVFLCALMGFKFAPWTNLFVNICSVILPMTGAIFICLMMFDGIEIREHGCVDFWKFIPWQEIDSHEWTQPRVTWKDTLMLLLRIKRRHSPEPLEIHVRADRKEEVDAILRAYYPGEHSPHTRKSTDGTIFSE